MSVEEVCSLQANDTNILSDVPEEQGNMLVFSIYAMCHIRITSIAVTRVYLYLS